MALKDMKGKWKERFWKALIPKEYRTWTPEQIQEKYEIFYDKLASMFGDMSISRKDKEKYMLEHQRLIKAVQIYEKKLKNPNVKSVPRSLTGQKKD